MRIVFSACLLGLPMRYDGRDKRVPLPAAWASAEKVHFCPESAAGLGIPRECIQLVQCDDGAIRVLGCETRMDVTSALQICCLQMIDRLKASAPVDLFVLKARSPSCGKVSALYDGQGRQIGTAAGFWAAKIAEHFPGVPCITEEEIEA